MYTAIDNVVKKLAQQARKKQNKNKAEAKGGLNMCEVEKIVKGTE